MAGIGIAVTVASVMMLVVLIVLIRRKSRELKDSDKTDVNSSKSFPSRPIKKYQEGWVDYLVFQVLCFIHVQAIFQLSLSFVFYASVVIDISCRTFNV